MDLLLQGRACANKSDAAGDHDILDVVGGAAYRDKQ
jgi:hypothetical protein